MMMTTTRSLLGTLIEHRIETVEPTLYRLSQLQQAKDAMGSRCSVERLSGDGLRQAVDRVDERYQHY